MGRPTESSDAIRQLDELTRRLRRECPWDREQDERSIVAHTVEESYELADAAHAGDDAKLLDELGDVLFQVMFLSLLLEERNAGDLAAVAEHCRQKLIRRHPHVFAAVEVAGAADVLRNWDEIKRGERGERASLFGELPENLPALLYARKVQRRAAGRGAAAEVPRPRGGAAGEAPRAEPTAAGLHARVDELVGADARGTRFEALGELLFDVVAVARELGVDPELALRDATTRFMTTQGDPSSR